jgi:hypothetical protein
MSVKLGGFASDGQPRPAGAVRRAPNESGTAMTRSRPFSKSKDFRFAPAGQPWRLTAGRPGAIFASLRAFT